MKNSNETQIQVNGLYVWKNAGYKSKTLVVKPSWCVSKERAEITKEFLFEGNLKDCKKFATNYTD